MSILCPNLRTKPNEQRNNTPFALSPSKEKSSASSSLPLGTRELTENPANSTAQLLLSGHLETGGTWSPSGSRGAGLRAPSPGGQEPYVSHLTEIRNSPMIPTRPARWSRLTCGHGAARMREEIAMTVIPMVTRRLLRTKQAAAYLSMSEWKLRRLIQTEIIDRTIAHAITNTPTGYSHP